MMICFFVVSFMLIFCRQSLESSLAVGVVGGEVNINITINDRSIDTGRELRDPNGWILLIFNPKAANAAYIDPNVTYTGNIPGGFVSFTLSKLTIQSAGIYRYTISKGISGNVIAGEHNLVIAGSPNSPVITAFSPQAVAGMEYKLNCSALSTSEKPGHNLTMFSEWKRNGTNITSDDSKYSVNGTILTIRNLSKIDNNASLTCIAFEDQRVKSLDSTTFSLNVYYGPDSITLYPSQMFYDLLENSSLNVNCTADCVPSCQYRWTGPGVNYSDKTGILSISKISRHQTGDFTCTAFNPSITSNSATATVLVTVQYGPDSITLSPSQMSYDLVENSSLNINCSAECVPSCQYRWTGPGVNYPDKTGILFISKINRHQSGVFKCTGSNTILTSNSATATVLVRVLYSPVVNFTSPVKVIQGQPLEVICSADGNPSPQVSWNPAGEDTANKSRLYYSAISRDKAGVHTCTATNNMVPTNGSPQLGSGYKELLIDVLCIPSVPQNVIVGINGPDSVTLEWTSGIDLGHPQGFVIQYRIFPDGSWVNLDPIKETGSTKQSITVNGLLQKTTYEFCLHAENIKELSNNMSVIVRTTEIKECAFPVGAVAGSISGTLVAGACVVFVIIFMWRRGQKNKKQGATYESVDVARRSSNKENAYDSLNHDKMKTSDDSAYENTGASASLGNMESRKSPKDENMEMTSRKN